MEIIKSFFRFALNPKPDFQVNKGIQYLLILLVFQYAVDFGFRQIDVMLKYFNITFGHINKSNFLSSTSQVGLPYFLILWIFAPIKEELKYRFFLGNCNLQHVNVSLSILISDLLFLGLSNILSFELRYYGIPLYNITVLCFGMILFFSAATFFNTKKDFICFFLKKHYPILVFSSAILFSAWHVFFSPTNDRYYLSLILSYMFYSYVFTYIRVGYGIYIVIAYHILYNAPFFILRMLLL